MSVKLFLILIMMMVAVFNLIFLVKTPGIETFVARFGKIIDRGLLLLCFAIVGLVLLDLTFENISLAIKAIFLIVLGNIVVDYIRQTIRIPYLIFVTILFLTVLSYEWYIRLT